MLPLLSATVFPFVLLSFSRLCKDPDEWPFIDLDTLDIPAYDLVDLSKYSDSLDSIGISYESSRGCPYACTFCVNSTSRDISADSA